MIKISASNPEYRWRNLGAEKSLRLALQADLLVFNFNCSQDVERVIGSGSDPKRGVRSILWTNKTPSLRLRRLNGGGAVMCWEAEEEWEEAIGCLQFTVITFKAPINFSLSEIKQQKIQKQHVLDKLQVNF